VSAEFAAPRPASPRSVTVAVLSDIHYASAAEQAHGSDFEFKSIASPFLRRVAEMYRRWIWLRDPLGQNGLLDRFLAGARGADFVVANGDYSCDTAFVGVSHDAAFQSAKECLGILRATFGDKLRATLGDHELGKLSLFAAWGGMRLDSWRRATQELGLQPFWQVAFGNQVLMGVASSLVALPVFVPDTLSAELCGWERLRDQHLAEIRTAFAALRPEQRVLLFCHDPTALPFLWREEAVRDKLPQIEHAIIGHLHTRLIFWKSKLLAGMPVVRFLGPSAQRMSAALNEARRWRPFHVRLCPALAGIELLNDGGYLTIELDPDARQPARFRFHPLRR
jgi:hypothetical protein